METPSKKIREDLKTGIHGIYRVLDRHNIQLVDRRIGIKEKKDTLKTVEHPQTSPKTPTDEPK